MTRRTKVAIGVALVGAWAIWWGVALTRMRLPGAELMWFRFPAFGADFWSQSDYAARLWRAGVDPYENERHLFHYPPIVIRLFLWTPYLSIDAALRVWIVVLATLLALGTVLAHRTRHALGQTGVPLVLLLGLVLLSFPSMFTLERSNFDLVTLAALVLAVPLLSRRQTATDLLGGALLAFGPWVKIYPGLLVLGLVVLRRFRALAGLVLGGLAILFAMPLETLRSFQILAIAIRRVRSGAHGAPFAEWSHSLSIAWADTVDALPWPGLSRVLGAVPGSLFAGLVLVVPLAWVCVAVWRCRRNDALTYPLLLWIIALASFVPEIANDYSLAFLPLAAACVLGARDSRATWAAAALALPTWQPFALPVPGSLLLALKVAGLVAVGRSLVRHARELDQGEVEPAAGAALGAVPVASRAFIMR